MSSSAAERERRSGSPGSSTHGFRYLQLKGWPGRPTPADIDGRAVHTDLAGRGEFLSSNPLLNSIQECSRRSTVYNYHGFPTDCPQRERNGWTGDAHCSAEQALLNFDMDAAYRKWMADIRDCQRASGQIPAIVPTGGWGFTIGSGPAWDSAAILIPWYLYLYRGDAATLTEHYECMRRYVEFLGAMEVDGIIDTGLGDWCPPEWHPSVVWEPTYRCPVALTDTAYYHLDARILSMVAGILGKAADQERYEILAGRVRRAFRGRFLDPATGRVTGDCQASLACALDTGMVDPKERDAVMARLVESVEAAHRHIDAGMLGAKFLMRVLTDADRVDLAYAIATQTTYPGWGEWIQRGATTLWETWSGDSSLNHHAFSDISAWFYRALAGLRPDAAEPGFRHFRVRPHPAGICAGSGLGTPPRTARSRSPGKPAMACSTWTSRCPSARGPRSSFRRTREAACGNPGRPRKPSRACSRLRHRWMVGPWWSWNPGTTTCAPRSRGRDSTTLWGLRPRSEGSCRRKEDSASLPAPGLHRGAGALRACPSAAPALRHNPVAGRW